MSDGLRQIAQGDRVLATTAFGSQTPMSGVTRGRDFPTIWVVLPVDFERDGFARTEHWRPWPAEDVVLADA